MVAALLVVAASMSSCKKDVDSNTFTLKTQNYTGEGKTYYDNFATKWQDGDKIYINGVDANHTATVVETSGTYTAQTAAKIMADNNNFYACYPGKCNSTTFNDASYSNGSFTVTMPSTITYSGTTLNCPMMGIAGNDHVITFTNVCALLKVAFTTVPSAGSSFTITSASTAITGDFTWTYNSGTSTWDMTAPTVSATNKTITVSCDGTSSTFYVAIPAGSHQLTIGYTKSMTSAQTFNKGTVYNISISALKVVPIRALNGEFSVSGSKKVKFAAGNVVCTRTSSSSSDWTWGIYAKQYMKQDQTTNPTANDCEISMFCWGYDATNSVNPINSTSRSDDWVDFGTPYNVGGDTWETLTKDELDYLLGRSGNRQNTTHSSRMSSHAYATVCGVSGVVIFPDSYRTQASCTYKDNGTTKTYDFPISASGGTIAAISTEDDWQECEANGWVFLPANLKYRNGSVWQQNFTPASVRGFYMTHWTTNPVSNRQKLMSWVIGTMNTANNGQTTYATAVRLVRPISSAK